jgi:hypothetical protein
MTVELVVLCAGRVVVVTAVGAHPKMLPDELSVVVVVDTVRPSI